MKLDRPSRLPKARDHLAAMLADDNITGLTTEIHGGTIDAEVGQNATRATLAYFGHFGLAAAELFWVAEPMTQLTRRSCSGVEPWLPPEEVPSPTGLLIWESGIPGALSVPIHSFDNTSILDMVGVMWTTMGREDAVFVSPLIIATQLPDSVDFPSILLPSLVLFSWGKQTDLAGVLGDNRLAIQATRATWLLMQQPNLAEYQPVEVDRDIRRSYGRADRPPPAVKLVTLRRPPGMGSAGTGSGRDYAHQWIVNGHWRNQPWGSGRSQRRRQWIAPYIKGPEDAPMLEQTKVKVWRR